MKILNFGSLNLDHVYRVDHFVRPGETMDSISYSLFCGGKGLNQSIALAHAGAKVFHAGRVGPDGGPLLARMCKAGADTSCTSQIEEPTGHAIIQVNKAGENCIILYGGANRKISPADAAKVLRGFSKGDYLLLQNEISSTPAIMKIAAERGLKIFFNPAPMTPAVLKYPLRLVDCFILNEVEGRDISGEKDPRKIISLMTKRFPKASIVLTLGSKGALFCEKGRVEKAEAVKVKAVDTTAAGDTFIGFFMVWLAEGKSGAEALNTACKAAAICVTRHGAADSIPRRSEL